MKTTCELREEWKARLAGGGRAFKHPGVDLRGKENPNKDVKVSIPCSISYNGGTVIDDKWYSGYDVAPPIVPDGYELVDLLCGYELNAHPPLQAMIMRKGAAP